MAGSALSQADPRSALVVELKPLEVMEANMALAFLGPKVAHYLQLLAHLPLVDVVVAFRIDF